MTTPDRIPCVCKGCRRTAKRQPSDEASTQIICGKCWREHVPARLKNRYKRLRAMLRAENRKLHPDELRLEKLERIDWRNWKAICRSVNNPTMPAGLNEFLKEAGL